MHRAGKDRAGWHRFGWFERLRIEIFFRVGRKLGAAAARAEEIGDAAMGVPMRRRRRVNRHAADGVCGFGAGCSGGRHCIHPYHLVTDEKNAQASPLGCSV
jgi:hypothetical protein